MAMEVKRTHQPALSHWPNRRPVAYGLFALGAAAAVIALIPS